MTNRINPWYLLKKVQKNFSLLRSTHLIMFEIIYPPILVRNVYCCFRLYRLSDIVYDYFLLYTNSAPTPN